MRWLARMLFATYLIALSGVAVANNAATNSPTDVYAGPDDRYPVVAQLDVDMPIEVMGCLDDWSWCDVDFADSRGWVYAPYITYDYEGGYVPLYAYAPGLGIPVEQFTIETYWGSYYRDQPWYGQRADWVHRDLSHHRRPSGPPPSAGPPPRSARVEKPHEAAHGGALRLGSAEPQHREAAPSRELPREPTPSAAEPTPSAAEPPRPAGHASSPMDRPDQSRNEESQQSPERSSVHAEPQHRDQPPRHEDSAALRPEAARREERPRDKKPEERGAEALPH